MQGKPCNGPRLLLSYLVKFINTSAIFDSVMSVPDKYQRPLCGFNKFYAEELKFL